MKTRENFEAVRNQRNSAFSLRFRLTALVTAEILAAVLIAWGLYYLLIDLGIVSAKAPIIHHLIVTSLLIGILVTGALSRWFFDPIKKLNQAMEKVADGDLSVVLETRSSSKEIREVYSGFNLMMHELNSTEILQSGFVSDVSHELKTPIGAIEGYSMLLQEGDNLSPKQREYVEKILFNTRRLSRLTGSILLLSKIENQSIPTNKTLYSLDEQIRQSVVGLETEWEKKQIELDVELDDQLYFGNESLMHHVWDNVIGNAIKFNKFGGFVRIKMTSDEKNVYVTIEDSGPGLDENAKKHVFDKFYQADSSHKDDGNGLGLALVKKILNLEGGSVSADNAEEGGCRFTVTLKKPQPHSEPKATAKDHG